MSQSKKRILSLLFFSLLYIVIMAFVACGGTGIPTDTNQDTTPEDTNEVTEMATEAPTQALTEAPTETPTEAPTEAPTEPETEPVTEAPTGEIDSDFKAMWLSQFDMKPIYTAAGGQRPEENFRKSIAKVMQNVASWGFNTVIVQMRPNADSFYPSEYYPPSSYVVGGYANDFVYDPMPIVIEEAHNAGLEIHAWINPLRCMKPDEMAQVSDEYLIKQWYNLQTPAEKNTRIILNGVYLYLNPAYPEVRELIVNGALEIIKKYDVDGLHMDDYFYPTTAPAFDARAYAAYESTTNTPMSLADWRRDNINKLVKSLYAAVKAEDPSVTFGISPAGNITHVHGEDYADVYTWCANEGYIDYICPQVYFGFEHASFPFDRVCHDWQNLIKVDSVKLVVGVTFGKAQSGSDGFAGTGKNEWSEHKDILKRCVEYTSGLEKCVGMSVFCYQYFVNPNSGLEVRATEEERANFVPVFKDITWFEEE